MASTIAVQSWLTIEQGWDKRNVVEVVDCGCPNGIVEAGQHRGRAVRADELFGKYVLLVEDSVFRVKKDPQAKKSAATNTKKKGGKQVGGLEEAAVLKPGESEPLTTPKGVVYVKKIEADLRSFIETTGCRRVEEDRIFANPPRRLREWYDDQVFVL